MKIQAANKQKLFSIILATHNCGQKIENTFRSIFSQNAELFEVIVIDGASTDDTLDYIKKYRNRITLVSERDDGVYHAFNKAVDLAAGKYLYFIGAGDCLKPDVLEKIKEYLPPEAPALVYGNVYFAQQQRFNGKQFDARLFARDNLCQQGIFYQRDVFRLVGNFDLRYKILSDWHFNAKCFLDDRIAKRYVDCVIADYEEGGLSADINSDPVFLREFPLFVRKHFGVYQYLLCTAFLRSPYLFNCLYYKQFYLLALHLREKHPAFKIATPVASFFVRGFKTNKINGLKGDAIK